MRTGGAERNATYLESRVDWGSRDRSRNARFSIDPQTSGGLLVAVPAATRRRSIFRRSRGVEIGEVVRASATRSRACVSRRGSGWSLVALTVFKTVRDLTTSGWVGSIPMHSRQLALASARRNPAASL